MNPDYTISTCWDTFKETVLSDPLFEPIESMMSATFYAGAYSMFTLMTNMRGKTKEEKLAILLALSVEMEEFKKERG